VDWIIADPPRDLTLGERAILDVVIEANPDHRDALRSLFRDSKVETLCPCGCGGFGLTINGSPPQTLQRRLAGEAAATVDGVYFDAMLSIAEDGAELDFNWYCKHDKRPGHLPRPDELKVASIRKPNFSRSSGLSSVQPCASSSGMSSISA
jgi:hypothetical protein